MTRPRSSQRSRSRLHWQRPPVADRQPLAAMLLSAAVLSVAALCAATSASASIPCVCAGNRTECSDHGVTSIAPQDVCQSSTVWIFCDNALTELPRVDDHVEELDLARNRISSAGTELRDRPGLRALDVSGNSLDHLRFLPQPCGLVRLSASGNRIASLDGPLSGCAALEELWLSDNRLGAQPDGAFAALGNLRALSLSSNPLRYVTSGTFRGLTRLVTLELSRAELESLPDGTFAGLGELRLLDLDGNHLRSVSRGTFRGLSALADLHLCGNHISSLPVDTFRDVSNLTCLFMNENELTSVPEGVFDGLLLEELWVRGNALRDIPLLGECCPRLRVVAFSSNRAQAPSEAALRALLRVEEASIRGSPLSVRSLAWAARAEDVEMVADPLDCHCGSLRLARQPHPRPALALCVDVECGEGAAWSHWVEAVRAAAENDV